MTINEFSVIAAALATYYPEKYPLNTQAKIELVFDAFKDLDYAITELVIKEFYRTEKWTPTVAEIRTRVFERVNPSLTKDYGDGWQQVCEAIRRYGFYRPEEAYESMDEITRQCVKRIGWSKLCMSENIDADRANFREMYKTISEREKKNVIAGDVLNNLISETAQKLRLEQKNGAIS